MTPPKTLGCVHKSIANKNYRGDSMLSPTVNDSKQTSQYLTRINRPLYIVSTQLLIRHSNI